MNVTSIAQHKVNLDLGPLDTFWQITGLPLHQKRLPLVALFFISQSAGKRVS
jgi:hypothetical protein